MTGLQLLGIWQDVEANPDHAEEWRKRLLDTEGILEGSDDWQVILNETPEQIIDEAPADAEDSN